MATEQGAGAIPPARRPDLLIELIDDDGAPVFVCVVEVQLRRDDRKRYAWPWYVATIHTQRECPTQLVVVTTRTSVARWCALVTRSFQPSCPFEPLVLGPENLPWITEPEMARQRPQLTLVGALVHSQRPDIGAVAEAVAAAIDALDMPDPVSYAIGILEALGAPVLRALEERMSDTRLDQAELPKWAQILVQRGRQAGQLEGREEGRE